MKQMYLQMKSATAETLTVLTEKALFKPLSSNAAKNSLTKSLLVVTLFLSSMMMNGQATVLVPFSGNNFSQIARSCRT
jgi:hypothetical protein